MGQKIYSGNISNTINEINVEHLNEGFYILYLVDGGPKNFYQIIFYAKNKSP